MGERGIYRMLITFGRSEGSDNSYRDGGPEGELQFKEGIEETVKWYLDNQAWMDNITSGEYEKYYESMYANR